MATIFETRLIGNIGKDAILKNIENGIIAINFSVAHNKNWKDKRSGESKTKTTWVNCTIWKKEGDNLRVLDFLKKGALVELIGTPFAKAFMQEDGVIRTEIRLNISKTNILRPAKFDEHTQEGLVDHIENSCNSQDDCLENSIDDYTLNEEDF